MKLTRNIAITLICVILGVMVAWQYKSVNYYESVSSFENKRVEDLKEELIKLQDTKNDLQTRLEELKQENLGYEKARAGDDEITQNLQKELSVARIFAGLVDVKGKGLIVTLDNDVESVQDTDVLNVINELRAAGAQAISVNDERVVATTEVRAASDYIMINGVQMKAPFVIKAISDPDKLERSLTMIGGVLSDLESYQIKADVKKSDEILIKKVRDDGSVIKYNLLTPVQ